MSTPELHMCVNRTQHYVVGAQAAFLSGTYRYDAAATRWRHWGADDTTITGLVIDPRDPAVVVTSAQNGMWRSQDRGASWRIMNSWRFTDARGLALDPSRPDEVYLALPDGIGHSPDGGRTWTRREDGLPVRGRYTQAVAVDRDRPGFAFAACESGLYATRDAGRRWWLRVPTRATTTAVVQDALVRERWFATTEQDGLWRSDDAGERWRQVSLPGPTSTLYDVTTAEVHRGLVAVVDHDHGLWLSEDGGERWRQSRPDLPGPVRAHRVGVEPRSGALFLATYGSGLHTSTDLGLSWEHGGMAGSEVRAFVIGVSA
ncbi:hypothetical protein [Pseudactinotalea suaedae]|uniref:hypothetical protein n=1 Tax=Pseudactinotalea suaedae TaxID=1524924 RepID=UPI0012E1392F|nr:hypothetical protein [Pseudactinotalea suaedae]